MADELDALSYLAKPGRHPARSVCVAYGDEPFLQRQVIAALREEVLGEGDGDFSFARFEGDDAELRDVMDELSTVALFGGGQRLVVVDRADPFITRHRPELEDYVQRPRSAGILVLSCQTWQSNTRLYKLVASSGLPINCKTPTPGQTQKWLVTWAKRSHQAQLDHDGAELLLEMVGPDLGLLDQQLAKLATSVGIDGTIGADLVEELVGGWRAKTAWEMLDLALEGRTAEALVQLDRLLAAGEHPIGLLAQWTSSLRRLAAAARAVQEAEVRGKTLGLRPALEQAGCKPFVLAKSESQLRRLGRQRAIQISQWLIQADQELKGDSQLSGRVVLERLAIRLAAPQPAGGR